MPVSLMTPLTDEQAYSWVSPVTDEAFTELEVATALAAVDQASIISEEDAEYNYVIWDQVSAINGVAAATVLARHPIPAGGVCYLLQTSGGRVVKLQPFQPGVAGNQAILPGSAASLASDDRNTLVNARALQRIHNAILTELAWTPV